MKTQGSPLTEIGRRKIQEHLELDARDDLDHHALIGGLRERRPTLSTLSHPPIGHGKRANKVLAAVLFLKETRPHRLELLGPVDLTLKLAQQVAQVIDIIKANPDIGFILRNHLLFIRGNAALAFTTSSRWVAG